VHLLQFTADGMDGTVFGADSAADAEIVLDLGFFTDAGQEVLDRFGGADRGAEAAVDAFVIIDAGQVVFHCDGLDGAFAAAHSAAYAGGFVAAELFGLGAFGFG